MRLLRRRVTAQAERGDRGAVAILVAALLAGGTLLGMLALVVDMGRLFEERRQLQNGSDAAAVALANSCAKGRSDCTRANAPGVADAIVDLNARDGLADVAGVCGNAADLSACAAPTASVYDCGPLPASGTSFIEVRASTRSARGGFLLHVFIGGSSTIGSCSRVAWGSPGSNSGISFTISICEWQNLTTNGTVYAPPPPYPPNPPTSVERVVYFHTATQAGSCPGGPAGQNAPGGFGWLAENNGACNTRVSAGGTAIGDPGNSLSSACKPVFDSMKLNRQVVYIPVFDSVTGTGSSTQYHFAGFAAFVITGWNVPGGKNEKSWLTGATPCTGEASCVSGFFTTGVLSREASLGGPNFGVTAVRPIP